MFIGMGLGLLGQGGAALAIPTANLLAEYRLNEGSGQWVYNRANALVAQVNLLPHANNATWAFNATFTRNFATDPDGGDGAARLFSSSANGNCSVTIAEVITTYTFSLYAKSNTGSDAPFRVSIDGGTANQSFTATTSWQRFTYTKAIASAASRDVIIRSDPVGGTIDILVYGMQLEIGSSATAYKVPSLDLSLGNTAVTDSNDPVWTASGLDFHGISNAQAIGTNTTQLTVTNLTCYMLCRWLDGAVTPATRDTQMIGETGTNIFQLLGGDGATAPWVTSRYGSTTNVVYGRNIQIDDGNWHLLTFTADAATHRLWYRGWEFRVESFVVASVALRSLWLGGRSGQSNGFPGEIAYASLYTATHTAAQVLATTQAIDQLMATPRGITIPPMSKMVVVEGDSISMGGTPQLGGYSRYGMATLSTPKPGVPNRAVQGNRISDLTARASVIDALYDPTRSKNILTVLAGTNDLVIDGITGATLCTRLKTYCAARKAAGWTVLVCTLLPCTQTGGGGSFDARRDACNTLIHSDVSGSWDGIVDFAADATMGPDGAASNATYYSDGTHPTVAGHQILGPIWATAVNAVL